MHGVNPNKKTFKLQKTRSLFIAAVFFHLFVLDFGSDDDEPNLYIGNASEITERPSILPSQICYLGFPGKKSLMYSYLDVILGNGRF